MNILIIASNYFPRMCGYSTRLHGIVSHLAELGHSVTILTPRYSKEMNEFENYAPNITVKIINIVMSYFRRRSDG